MNYFSKNKGLPREAKRSGGFTLVELIVVIAIASVIMTALVIQQSKWNDSLVVSTQAYEMALMVRQAQVYALGVRENTAGAGDKFNIGYGVYIDIGALDRYTFFVDRNKDFEMNAGEAVETKIFTRGVKIKSLCGVNVSGAERCYPQNGINQVAISFYRPEPKAIIKFFNSPGNPNTSVGPPTNIYLQSLGGKEANVKIEANGQVSITQ